MEDIELRKYLENFNLADGKVSVNRRIDPIGFPSNQSSGRRVDTTKFEVFRNYNNYDGFDS